MIPTSARRNAPILVAMLALAPLSSGNAQTERRAISGERVSIYNLAGKLRVQPTTGTQVVVDVTRAGSEAAKLKLATGDIRGWQSLRIIYPTDRIVYGDMGRRSRTQLRVNADGTFDDNEKNGDFFGRDRVEIRDSGPGTDAHADLVVGVPKGQRIAIHWGVGDALVTNVDGDIRVSVASATISSEHTRGHLSLDTGSGGITVSDAQGDAALDTGSGSITVTGMRGESLGIDAGSGSVHADDIDARTLKAGVGSGGLRLARVRASRISVDAGSGGAEIELVSAIDQLTVDAGSGGVTVHMPAAQGADVDIETGSGGIDSDFAVQTTHLERNHLRGRIGDGHARIKIESGSGHVRLIKN